MRGLRAAGALFVAGLSALAAPVQAACPGPLDMQTLPPEARPAPHPWPQWAELNRALSRRLSTMRLEEVELAFLGDSLVASWTPALFQHFYGHRRALNLGVAGDTTQTLLWRLRQGGWPAALRPRAVVVLVGTNNAAFGWHAAPTAQAILSVVEEVRARAPGVRVVLVGLLPRGAEPDDAGRRHNQEVNRLLAACHDGRTLFWLDAADVLLDGRQRLTSLVSYDQLHLTPYGYAILSTAMEGAVRAALEAPAPANR